MPLLALLILWRNLKTRMTINQIRKEARRRKEIKRKMSKQRTGGIWVISETRILAVVQRKHQTPNLNNKNFYLRVNPALFFSILFSKYVTQAIWLWESY